MLYATCSMIHDISIAKTRQDYNSIANYFSATRNRIWPELNQFKDLIKDGQNILDWGCGNGHMLEFFNGYDIKYFGVDISDNLIELANESYASEVKSGRAQFFKIGENKKDFPNEFFDLVFMVASFHHLPDEASRLEVLQKVYNEIKVGGKLIIIVWNLQSDWAKSKHDFELIDKQNFLIPWKDKDGKIICQRYYHHFTPEELTELLEKVGFKIKQIGYFENNTFFEDKKNARNLVVLAVKK